MKLEGDRIELKSELNRFHSGFTLMGNLTLIRPHMRGTRLP